MLGVPVRVVLIQQELEDGCHKANTTRWLHQEKFRCLETIKFMLLILQTLMHLESKQLKVLYMLNSMSLVILFRRAEQMAGEL